MNNELRKTDYRSKLYDNVQLFIILNAGRILYTISIGLLLLAIYDMVTSKKQFYSAYTGDMAVTGAVVLILNTLERLRETNRFRNSILLQLSSADPAIVENAIIIAKQQNWLTRGFFKRTKLNHVNLQGCSLNNAVFDKVDFSYANFSNAHLIKATFNGAILDNTNFEKTILRKAELYSASIHASNFDQAELDNAQMSKIHGTRGNFRNASLRDALVREAVLTNADFTESDLVGADFSNTDLTQANFTSSDISRTNFTGAELPNKDSDSWQNVKWEISPTWPNGFLPPENFWGQKPVQ